jgi:hypothetical protein
MLKIKEKELYPFVEEFIRKRYNCFMTYGEIGVEGIGYPDVFGVHHTNLEKTDVETIAVEVKTRKSSTCADFGQAKGYCVYHDKVYFASLDEFSNEDKEIAKYLGIGLIGITKQESGYLCDEVLKPSTNTPIKRLQNKILEKRKILACQACKVIQERNYIQTVYGLDKIYLSTQNEVKKGKDLLIKNKDRKELYCNRCARIILKLN